MIPSPPELAKMSEMLTRAAEAMAREAFALDIEWARFLAEGEQWVRITEGGIQIIPRDQIYKRADEE